MLRHCVVNRRNFFSFFGSKEQRDRATEGGIERKKKCKRGGRKLSFSEKIFFSSLFSSSLLSRAREPKNSKMRRFRFWLREEKERKVTRNLEISSRLLQFRRREPRICSSSLRWTKSYERSEFKSQKACLGGSEQTSIIFSLHGMKRVW